VGENGPTLDLKKMLSPGRYRHSLSVAKLARELARRHGWNPERAYQAGLLHDITKEWSRPRLIAYVKRYRLRVPGLSFILRTEPTMLHSYVAADWVARQGWVTDRPTRSAIACHTLGGVRVTIPQMILYVADFAAWDRGFHSARRVRGVARRNLKEAYRMALAKKIEWNLIEGKPLHPLTIQLWNSLFL